jgi:hypothetical protein
MQIAMFRIGFQASAEALDRSNPFTHTLDTDLIPQFPDHAHSQHGPQVQVPNMPQGKPVGSYLYDSPQPTTSQKELPSALTCVFCSKNQIHQISYIHHSPSFFTSSTQRPSSPPRIQYQASAVPSSPHGSTSGRLPAHPLAP